MAKWPRGTYTVHKPIVVGPTDSFKRVIAAMIRKGEVTLELPKKPSASLNEEQEHP